MICDACRIVWHENIYAPVSVTHDSLHSVKPVKSTINKHIGFVWTGVEANPPPNLPATSRPTTGLNPLIAMLIHHKRTGASKSNHVTCAIKLGILFPSLAPPAPAATCSSSTASPSPPPPPAPRPRCVYTQARPCACRGLRVRGTWVRCVRSLIFSTPGSCRGAAGGSSWRRSWGAPCSSPRPTGSGPRRRGGSRRGPRTSTCSRGSTPRWIRRASRYVGRGGCLVGSGDQVLLADRVEMGGSWFGPVV